MCKKKKRKSQKKNFKKPSLYSVPKLIKNVEYCYKITDLELRKALVEDLNITFLKWCKERVSDNEIKKRYTEIQYQIAYWANEGKRLRVEATKCFGNLKHKESLERQAYDNERKADFIIDLTLLRLGKTSEDFKK